MRDDDTNIDFRIASTTGEPLTLTPPFQSRMKWQSWQLPDSEGAAFTIQSPAPPPNAWYRFWARVLLGVVWEEIE